MRRSAFPRSERRAYEVKRREAQRHLLDVNAGVAFPKRRRRRWKPKRWLCTWPPRFRARPDEGLKPSKHMRRCIRAATGAPPAVASPRNAPRELSSHRKKVDDLRSRVYRSWLHASAPSCSTHSGNVTTRDREHVHSMHRCYTHTGNVTTRYREHVHSTHRGVLRR